MKKNLLSLLLLFTLLLACNSENSGDCLQTAGPLQREVRLEAAFSRITVFENLNLVIRQGSEFRVEVESGANLLNEITAEVIGDRLILRNENRCNLFRDYGISTVYVTAPELREIRSGTGFLVSSDGTLNYDSLTLISERFNNPETDATDGRFDLDFSGNRLTVSLNGIAYVQLAGSANLLTVNIAAGDARVEATDLEAQEVIVDHRGSNDVLVDPQQRISGLIRGYGDVIGVSRPPEVDVDELFNGRLRFSSEN